MGEIGVESGVLSKTDQANAAAPKRKPPSPDIEGQCCEPSWKTVRGVSVARGTCVYLSVFVFSFGALSCAFLMNMTDRWELQVIAYGIATAATIASLFFISFVRTSPEGVVVLSPSNRAASSLRNRRLQASCNSSGRRGLTRPSNLWVPDWTQAGPFLSTPEHNEDWFVLSRQSNEQRSCMASVPMLTPVHSSPPASSALMIFEDAMVWSPPPSTPSGLLHI
ncbi:hypothetical protein MTO96_024840 [Rhipicephalus appendiculatus]